MAECGPNCEETLAEIQRFLDGELDTTFKIEIEQHLSSCSPCMQRAEFRRHLKVMISSKCTGDEVPESLRTRVMGLIGDLDTPTL
jgi:mycothiol system anti-sigma-R factor